MQRERESPLARRRDTNIRKRLTNVLLSIAVVHGRYLAAKAKTGHGERAFCSDEPAPALAEQEP